ncbi:hypothetical protein D3C87_2024760 [compost metagenome]
MLGDRQDQLYVNVLAFRFGRDHGADAIFGQLGVRADGNKGIRLQSKRTRNQTK